MAILSGMNCSKTVAVATKHPQPELDLTLADLQVANISRAIAEGSLVGQAQLGIAIGLVLRRERQD